MIRGHGGRDTLDGGAGDDTLEAGPGAQVFEKTDTRLLRFAGDALSIDPCFGLIEAETVFDSGTVPHATINARAAGGTVTLDIDGSSPDFDSNLRLLDSHGETQLASNDDDGGDPGSDDSFLDSRLTHLIAENGTYLIQVAAFSPDNGFDVIARW